MCDGGELPTLPQADPARSVAVVRRAVDARHIIHAGSKLIGQAGALVDGRSAGNRFPALPSPEWHRPPSDRVRWAPGLDQLRARWYKFVSIVDASSANFDAAEAGLPHGGAILVRPDGFIGFRAAPADETAMDALDAHLTTYLVPEVGGN